MKEHACHSPMPHVPATPMAHMMAINTRSRRMLPSIHHRRPRQPLTLLPPWPIPPDAAVF